MMDIDTIILSLFGSSGLAWFVAKLAIKNIVKEVIKESIKDFARIYTTREDMQKERKELLEEVERRFLSIVAFREFEKRIDEHFKNTDRRFADSSKRFDKVDASLEHITDLIIKKG